MSRIVKIVGKSDQWCSYTPEIVVVRGTDRGSRTLRDPAKNWQATECLEALVTRMQIWERAWNTLKVRSRNMLGIPKAEDRFQRTRKGFNRFRLQVSGYLYNTGQFLVFRAEREAKVRVNITGGPLAYHYQFEEICIHYGMDNDHGSEHRISNYAFPAEVSETHTKFNARLVFRFTRTIVGRLPCSLGTRIARFAADFRRVRPLARRRGEDNGSGRTRGENIFRLLMNNNFPSLRDVIRVVFNSNLFRGKPVEDFHIFVIRHLLLPLIYSYLLLRRRKTEQILSYSISSLFFLFSPFSFCMSLESLRVKRINK